MHTYQSIYIYIKHFVSQSVTFCLIIIGIYKNGRTSGYFSGWTMDYGRVEVTIMLSLLLNVAVVEAGWS